MVCLGRTYHFKFFKGCLPQILLGPFLNTLSHMVHQRQLIFFMVALKYLAVTELSVAVPAFNVSKPVSLEIIPDMHY